MVDTRKRRGAEDDDSEEEELQALPSDGEEEEEEYVHHRQLTSCTSLALPSRTSGKRSVGGDGSIALDARVSLVASCPMRERF